MISKFVDAEREALAVVDRYLAAINGRNTEAIRDAFNFPHVRVRADGEVVRYETQSDYHFDSFFALAGPDGWHRTEWDATKTVFATEHKAHVAVDFTRYREDGSVIGQYFSLYVATCQNGHWGIQVGSGNG